MGFDPQLPIENGMQVALVVIPVVFTLLAAVAVGLRVLARHMSNRRLDASDYIMFAALVFTMGLSGTIAAEPFTGLGLHMADLMERFGQAPLTTYAKMTIANQILWALAVCLPKISILLLYSRVFTMRVFIIAAKATGVVIIMLTTATVLGALLQCRPIAFNWDQTIPGGKCGDQVLSFKITGSMNVVLDVVVLLLPMPYLWTLELAWSKKLILILTFAVGFVTCVFSALRIRYIAQMDYADLTYGAGLPSIYSVLEPTLAITLACVPVLRPLLGGHYSANGTKLATPNTMRSGTMGSAKMTPRRQDTAGFQPMYDDNSSEHQLQPLGSKNGAAVSTESVT